MDQIHFVILGIGVNLNMDGRLFSREIRKVATSLKKEMGKAVSRKAFLQTLLQKLEAWYEIFLKEGAPPVLKAWRDRAQIKGRPVRVTSSGETWAGIAVDIDSDGNLILMTEDGQQNREDFHGLWVCSQGRGSRTVNVLPEPGSLLTPMVPLWASTIF
jgi:BirA family biotin operon repressor/biotin-[acetyl-CoA-carboxylase] ligase